MSQASCLSPLVVVDAAASEFGSGVDEQILFLLNGTSACALPNDPPVYYEDAEWMGGIYATSVVLFLVTLPQLWRCLRKGDCWSEFLYLSLPIYAQIAVMMLLSPLFYVEESGVRTDISAQSVGFAFLLPPCSSFFVWASHFAKTYDSTRHYKEYGNSYIYASCLLLALPICLLVFEETGFDPLVFAPFFQGLRTFRLNELFFFWLSDLFSLFLRFPRRYIPPRPLISFRDSPTCLFVRLFDARSSSFLSLSHVLSGFIFFSLVYSFSPSHLPSSQEANF